MAKTFLSIIEEHRLVPVIELDSSTDAPFLAEALLKGGLPVIELTFRTGAAAESIAAVRRQFPEMFVGAGTIVSQEQLQQAVDAGAQFLVSPGFDPRLTGIAVETGVPYLPGIATASELQGALALGIRACKFFPAEEIRGGPLLEDLSGHISSVLAGIRANWRNQLEQSGELATRAERDSGRRVLAGSKTVAQGQRLGGGTGVGCHQCTNSERD